jgi:iron complex outermembrane receptor protein
VNTPGTLAAYLARFMPAADAQAAALLFGGAAGSTDSPGIVAGTISPEGRLAGSNDVLLTYRNFGALSRWGADVAADLSLTDRFSINGTWSWTTKNFFPRSEVGGWADVALNAPKNKASLGVHLRDAARGVSASLSGRHVEGFPMSSGAFVGTVRSYTIADAGTAVRFGPGRNTIFSLSVQNLFDDRHREFVGAPVLGRSAMFQLQHTVR